MGNHFVINGQQYIVSIMTQENFSKFTMKVRKTRKQIGDREYIFIKAYKYQKLPAQIREEFKSIQEFHEYLTNHQDDLQIVQTNLKIKLKNNQEVLINFQNVNQNSLFIVNETNEIVQKRNQLGNTLNLLGNVLTNNHQKDNQIAFAKLYSFYEKLCKKNQNQNQKLKGNKRFEMVQLIDLIVEEYDLYENRQFGGANMKKKQSNLIENKNDQKIQQLEQEISRQKIVIQTLNDTMQAKIQATMQRMLKKQEKEFQKIRAQKKKWDLQLLDKVSEFVNQKRAQYSDKTSTVPVCQRFPQRGDLLKFIGDLMQKTKYLENQNRKWKGQIDLDLQIFPQQSKSSQGSRIMQPGQIEQRTTNGSQVTRSQMKKTTQVNISNIST